MDACKHTFIFSSGSWAGEGKILLNIMEEELIFNTNWNVSTRDCSGKVPCTQAIQIQGFAENMQNDLFFSNFQNKPFTVEMENPNVGRIMGTGVYDDLMIGWEFKNTESNFEGFETYYLQQDGSYLMRGEYVTSDQFRTQIKAKIWPASKEAPFNDEDSNEAGEDS